MRWGPPLLVKLLCLALTGPGHGQPELGVNEGGEVLMRALDLGMTAIQRSTLARALGGLFEGGFGVPEGCVSETCLLRQYYASLHVALTKNNILPIAPMWERRSDDDDDPRTASRRPQWLGGEEGMGWRGVGRNEELIIERYQGKR